MKKLIVKYWGVVLAIVLLSSLFVSAAPVSAAVLNYSLATNPNDLFGGITSAAAINDFAVANDGTTIYAATTVGVMKSTNGGMSWGFPVVPAGLTTTNLIAVCPDNPNMVAVMDTVGGGATSNVSLTVNGGTTWSTLGAPRSATGVLNATVTDIAISPTVGGTNYIAVSGSTAGAPSLFYFTYGLTIPGWLNACVDLPFTGYALTGAEVAFNAVAFSSNFNADFIALVVADDHAGNTNYNLHAISFNVFKFDAAIPSFATYPVTFQGTTNAVIATARIVTDPLYYGGDSASRVAYVGVDAGAVASSAVYRLTDVTPAVISAATQAYSLSLNADGSKLFVGQLINNNVITISNPASVLATPSNTRTTKRIGISTATDAMVVVAAGANVYAAKANTAGAFAVSTDNALTFNAISLVRCTAAAISDQAVSADGTKRYVMLNDGANGFLFYNDGTGWVNTYVNAGAGGVVLAPSPTNFDTLYIGDKANLNIYYTATAGKTNWLTRASPGTGTLADIEVLNDSTVYTLTTGGNCAKSSSNAFIWTAATAPVAVGASLTLVAEDQLIACSTLGVVAYTTNNGIVWVPLPATAAGNAYAVADGLATGSNIYVVNAANNTFYIWTIGTNTVAWTNPIAGAFATAGMTGQGVALYNGTLYAMYTSGINVETWRTLTPFLGTFAPWSGFTSVGGLLAGILNTNVGPNALKMSAGNQAWIANATAFNVVIITDTLADPANVPPLQSPANGALIQVNNETGIAYPANLVFGDASLATAYQVAIAYDDQFVNAAIAAIAVANAFGTQLCVVGPGTANIIPYQPGQTLYWRVRATAPFVSNWSETWSFSVMPGQAVVAQLASPANGASVTSLTPGFSWSPLGGITSYKFELAAAPTFATTMYSTTANTAGASIPSTVKLVRGVTYYWRVKALTPTEGDWSAVGNFMVAELPVVVTPVVTPQVTPTLTVVIPAATTTNIVITQEAPPAEQVVNPSYIWAIIIIGAVLVLAVIVLIVRTRRSV